MSRPACGPGPRPPALPAATWTGLGILLVVALAVFASGPVVAIHQIAHLGDTVGDLPHPWLDRSPERAGRSLPS